MIVNYYHFNTNSSDSYLQNPKMLAWINKNN